MGISLRIATTADLAAVNKRYQEVDFVPSHEGELIVLAFCDGNVVGQGRVGTVDAESGELGGIYVLLTFCQSGRILRFYGVRTGERYGEGSSSCYQKVPVV